MRSWTVALGIVVTVAACGGKKPHAGGEVKVAAASDLARAFEEVGKAFEAETGIEPVFTFGSTGLLAKQIEQGAPYDLFAAANVAFVDQVVKAGVCDPATQALYARGRIVLWSQGEVPARLEDLTHPKYETIAIANPDHAPYGRAAKEALDELGVWAEVQPRMVYGENILQTMQYAKSGNADVAIVALSLAVVADGGKSTPIDPALHAPLDQALVVCKGGANTEAARKFAAFVASPRGREIMTRYGFQLPDLAAQPTAPDRDDKGAGPGAGRAAPVDEAAVRALVDAWLAAQNGGDFAAYEALYAARFEGVKRVGARTWRFDRKGWLADRKKMFAAPMTVTAEDVEVDGVGPSAVVRLRQTFAQKRFKDTGDKQLVVVEEAGGLRIAREEMLRSTVLDGPGSAKATGLPVIAAADRRWLVLGDAGDVEVTDAPPRLVGAGGAAAYSAVEAPRAAPAWAAKLVGEPVTIYPSGATCAAGAIEVLHLLTPHFGTEMAWSGDEDGDGRSDHPPLKDEALASAVVDGGGARYLVADVSACGGDGDVLGVIGRPADAWVAFDDPALAEAATAAFRALPAYATLQDEYQQGYGGDGAWTDADGGTLIVALRRSPDGKATYAIVGAQAGTGCGDFAGGLVGVFRVGKGGAIERVGDLPVGPTDGLPTVAVDTNRDGRPELAAFASMWAFDGKGYQPIYQLDLGFRDCGC